MPTQPSALAAATLALAGLLPGSPRAQDLEPGLWRAVLASPGGELPFGLDLQRSPGGWYGWLVNGEERIPIPRVEVADGTLVIDIDHFDSRIEARLGEDGRSLAGTWRKRAGKETWAELPFTATAGYDTRFTPAADGAAGSEPARPIGGRWRVRFASDDEDAVGIFEEGPDGTVRGTFLTATGDYRFLAGRFEGGRLRLSCFDGAHAFLFDATLTPEGTLTGDFWSRDSWHDTWTATHDPEVTLPDAFGQTTWTDRASLADLVFPDVDGNPRSLTEAAFLGRATLVQVFGTWCPNCHDETAYLVDLHRRYAERGLSIVGLAFELTGDHERDAEQVRRFVARHDVPYPILIAGTANKAAATAAFPALDRVRSYPTTIFLDARGNVRAVHTGFSGPATGAAWATTQEEFEGRIEELLAEEVPTRGGSVWGALELGSWYRHDGWTGADYTFFREDEATLRALVREFGSGVPVTGSAILPVRVYGDAVWIGDEVWRYDPGARVLLSPRDAGLRIAPREDPTPRLRRSGIEGAEAWVDALDHGDPVVRREAIQALAREFSRRPQPPGFPQLIDLLADPAPEVRVAAAWAAGRCGERAAIPALLEALAHPHAALRRESVVALQRLLEPEAVQEHLLPRLQDPDPLVREAARAACGDER